MKTREKGSVDWQTPEGTKHDELVITDGNLPETLLSRTPSLSYPCLFTLQGLQQGAYAAQGTSPCKAAVRQLLKNRRKEKKSPQPEGVKLRKRERNWFS